jgi:hypothetical protein
LYPSQVAIPTPLDMGRLHPVLAGVHLIAHQVPGAEEVLEAAKRTRAPLQAMHPYL